MSELSGKEADKFGERMLDTDNVNCANSKRKQGKVRDFIMLFEPRESVEEFIQCCQQLNHIQQVAFSTYHHALTQICFTCEEIRTSLKEKDLPKATHKKGEENGR